MVGMCLPVGYDPGTDQQLQERTCFISQHTKNDDLREDRNDQEERRQDIRDDVFTDTDGGTDDLGSQDARRKEGRTAPELDALREDARDNR